MKYQIVNAFSKNGKGGNPAAVVLNHLSSADEKQDIARKIGFSETAFLTKDAKGFAIEFFTPEKPILYCGHATIAAVNILLQQGAISNGNHQLVTHAKPIDVLVADEMVYMKQDFPVFQEVTQNETANLYNGKTKLRSATIARNGVGFLLNEAASVDDVIAANPNQKAIYSFSENNNLIGTYLFAWNNGVLFSRMFAPFYGINEENATGMAAGLLGGWIHHEKKIKEITIEQGPDRNKRGVLFAKTVSHQNVTNILVGGEATVIQESEL